LGETTIKYVHILKNTLIPVITLVSVSIGSLLAGTVLTETVFSWPGLGRTFFYALWSRDYPTIQGIFIFLASSVVLINLFADVLYGFVDPRVRYT
jgi:ABC-type dipeptide/oligopeptide/nickel transport system permease component